MIKTKDSWIVDDKGRTVMLRGVNVAGSSKVPSKPNGATWNSEGFFDHRNISFVGKPFPLNEADEHFSRLKLWGFNTIRLLVTWEAIEHAGPGIIDREYLDFLYEIVKKAGEYGFYVIIDPHQDVFSRFCGGDGAPGWALEAVGFNIKNFKDTGAALVHQTHGDSFPKMQWPTNAYKLAAATMFTVFFAGNDFAPNTFVEGIPIQDYLQGHFFNAMIKVAEKLQTLDCVIGFDTFNEPQGGYLGLKDLRKYIGQVDLGIVPTPWQSMLLGAGIPQKVKILRRDVFGTWNNGTVTLNLDKKSAWLPNHECIWKQNGVWNFDQNGEPVLLRPDYFASFNGKETNFVQDYLTPFMKKMIKAVRSIKKEWIVFIETETNNYPPDWNEAADENLVNAPHWYDGPLMFLKTYIPWIGYNEITGETTFGTKRVKKAYIAQLGDMRRRTKENLGNIPMLLGEFGIPFDLDHKKAFKTGDFSSHIKAINRCMEAVESNLLNYTIWNYSPDNNNAHGDLWNDEDLSIFSPDQRTDKDDLNSGGRALQAVIRPFPQVITGEPIISKFDPFTATYHLEFLGNPALNYPTEIFLPKYHYPDGVEVKISDGKYEIDPEKQLFRYYQGPAGQHNITLQKKACK